MSEAESIPAFQMAACSKPSDTLCSSENRRCSLMPLTTSGLFFDIDEANCMEWAKAAAGVGWTLLSKPLAWASAESKRLPAKYWIPVAQKYEPVNNVMNQLAQDIPVYMTSLNQDRFATARGIRWTVPTSARDWRELQYARSKCEAEIMRKVYQQLCPRPLLWCKTYMRVNEKIRHWLSVKQ